MPDEFRPWLERIQNELFDLGADLSVPHGRRGRERLRVTGEQVERLEELCDEANAGLEPLRSFVLPGGTEAAANLHVARTICRRAERLAVELSASRAGQPARARVPEPPLRPPLHPRPRRERGRRRAALEAWELALAAAGSFTAALLGAAVGLVLGSLRLPVVLLASGNPAAAAGTNIAVSAVTALVGGIGHARAGRVNWRIVAWMAPPSVVGAFIGGFFGSSLPDRALLIAIAVVLFYSGLDMLFAFRPGPERPRRPRTAAAVSGALIGLLGGAVGLILGTLRLPALLKGVGLDRPLGRRHESRRRLLPRRLRLLRASGPARGRMGPSSASPWRRPSRARGWAPA